MWSILGTKLSSFLKGMKEYIYSKRFHILFSLEEAHPALGLIGQDIEVFDGVFGGT